MQLFMTTQMKSENQKRDFIYDVMASFETLCSYNVACFIACQFALESNFGQSRIARTRHNLCGMKHPQLRPTYDLLRAATFADYDSKESCFKDYQLWLAYSKFTQFDLSNVECFKAKLRSKNYCPETDYIDRIQSIFDWFNGFVSKKPFKN